MNRKLGDEPNQTWADFLNSEIGLFSTSPEAALAYKHQDIKSRWQPHVGADYSYRQLQNSPSHWTKKKPQPMQGHFTTVKFA